MVESLLKEEFKKLREEIFEIDKRISNYIVYSIIATATLLGFGIQSPSPYVFLLPFAILIPLSWKILSLQNDILFKGTYISLNIEQKYPSLQLNWETFLIEQRKRERKSKFYNQSPNTLLFTFLAILCLSGSISQTLHNFLISSYRFSWIINIPNLRVLEFLIGMVTLHFLWIGIVGYFIFWNYKMSKCFSFEVQQKLQESIMNINEALEN